MKNITKNAFLCSCINSISLRNRSLKNVLPLVMVRGWVLCMPTLRMPPLNTHLISGTAIYAGLQLDLGAKSQQLAPIASQCRYATPRARSYRRR